MKLINSPIDVLIKNRFAQPKFATNRPTQPPNEVLPIESIDVNKAICVADKDLLHKLNIIANKAEVPRPPIKYSIKTQKVK